jgi:hypothetical protein
MNSAAVQCCEFPNTIPPDNTYITLVCNDDTNAVAYSGQRALHLPDNFLEGIDSNNFVCCGLWLDNVSYINNHNITNHYTELLSVDNITNHYTNLTNVDNTSEYLSLDKYSYYSLVLNVISVLLSVIIIILYIIGMCNRGAENRVLRYMMYNNGANRRIPITGNLSNV